DDVSDATQVEMDLPLYFLPRPAAEIPPERARTCSDAVRRTPALLPALFRHVSAALGAVPGPAVSVLVYPAVVFVC
ncbi:MAG: hypothetical protein KDA85_19670, partial [Planctomycetaceae bacterium]|nr:hypothetical protein [Planctomycetaceae bacterium]